MFSRIPTGASTSGFSEKIAKLRDALCDCDAVVIGAGAGLSTAAGFVYDGERFDSLFPDFKVKYGFKDMYTAGFYPFPTPEEHWAYWSRFVYANRYQDAPEPLYEQLLSLVRDKDYFVITTNVDHCFQKAGFDKQRLFYTQGDYGRRRPSTTKRSSGRWSSGRRTCVFRPSLCPAARTAAGP